MNIFFVVILAALIINYLLGLFSSLLNLRALRMKPPAELEGVYPEEEYRRSQEYTRTNIIFELVGSTFAMVVLLAFWFSGGFNWLDEIVRAWGFGPIINGLFYTFILMFGYSLLTLPFELYETFVIEERFGFNRLTRRTYITDKLKGMMLGLVLGVPLLAGILALFEYGGDYAWVYGWAGVTLFMLGVQYVAPTWIMPLFNKFTPLEDGELRQAIFDLAGRTGFPVKNVYVMDGSKRSSKSNAFFTGFGNNKRIALFDTLIEKHTTDELVGVLAHEIGHYKKKHILKGTILSILHFGLLFFLLSVFLGSQGLYEAFFVEQASVYTGLIFFGLLYTPIEMFLSIGLNMYSRKNEYEADRFAVEATGKPRVLAEALKKLASHNLANLTPHPVYVFLNYSHPPLLDRVMAIYGGGDMEHSKQKGGEGMGSSGGGGGGGT